jgi:PelA/Pel-15E family pectate lyase
MRGIATIVSCAVIVLILYAGSVFAAPREPGTPEQALQAMKKAAHYFHDMVSTRGGYLCEYTVDLKHRFGELPARESQIWVQNPSTPGMGDAFLNAYRATGDPLYLQFAGDAARALVWGQMECGGWNYLIDFAPESLKTWYREISIHTLYDEFMHFNGNATFDDSATRDPTLLLLRLYDLTLDPAWLGPLHKALDFIMEAQFPNGAWPQRFPLIGTGYDTYYTYNDGVIVGNIGVMAQAYKTLCNPKYLDAARRGADFIVLSQHEGPQYGWGQQLSYDLRPAKARDYEPASLSVSDTMENLRCLMDMYELTGDRRYLEPVPRTLEWLDKSVTADGSIGTFLEEGSNRPMAAKFEGDSGDISSVRITYNLAEAMGGYGFEWKNFSTKDTRQRYESLKSATWRDPLAVKPAATSPGAALTRAQGMELDVKRIVASLDSLGRWTEDGRMYTKRYCYKNEMEYEGPDLKNGWVRTGTFIKNLNLLTEYTRLMKAAGKK